MDDQNKTKLSKAECKTSQTLESKPSVIHIFSKGITQVGRNNVIKLEDENSEGERRNDGNNNAVMSDTPESQQIDSSGDSSSSEMQIQRQRRRKIKSHKHYHDQLKLKVFQSIGPPDPSQCSKRFFEMSDDIMKSVQELRDNGQWALFDEAINNMVKKYANDIEASLVILLERSVALCYQNKLDDSEKIIRNVMNKSKNAKNYPEIQRRAHLYHSGVYRKMGDKTGKANKHTELAERTDCAQLTLDSIFIAYERGCVLMEFLAKCPGSRANIKEKAKDYLKKCIDYSRILEEDASRERYMKKPQFALIKIALLDLNCSTNAGRKKPIKQSDIHEAENCLSALEKYWDGMAQGEKVQYYLAKSDLHWRNQDFEEAHRSASTALKIAEKNGFVTEIKPAKVRLDQIKEMLSDVIMEHSPEVTVSDGEVYDSEHPVSHLKSGHGALTSDDDSGVSECVGSATDSELGGSSSCDTDGVLSSPLD